MEKLKYIITLHSNGIIIIKCSVSFNTLIEGSYKGYFLNTYSHKKRQILKKHIDLIECILYKALKDE